MLEKVNDGRIRQDHSLNDSRARNVERSEVRKGVEKAEGDVGELAELGELEVVEACVLRDEEADAVVVESCVARLARGKSEIKRGRTRGLFDAKTFELAIGTKRAEEDLPLLESDEVRSCAISVSSC